MKRFASGLLAFVLTMLVVAGLPLFCKAARADSWTGPDKQKHFAVSAAMASAAVAAGFTERQAFAASLAVGLAKELHDSRPGGTGFSGKDLAWDAAGAYLGAKLPGVIVRRGFIGYRWSL